MKESDSSPEYPGRYGFDSKWVIASVIVAFLAALSAIIKGAFQPKGTLDVALVGETTVTFFTGMWYWVRYHYTESATPKQKDFLSLFFSILIALTGLSCFAFAGYGSWFVAHAAVLCLGTEKDYEIIRHQKRIRCTLDETAHAGWKADLLVQHHWYSIVRDISMALWWIVYGIAVAQFAVPADKAILVFGIPYVILVMAWCYIKVKVYNIEVSMKSRGA